MTGLTAEGEASECGLGTGGTLAKGATGPWDFSSREGKGWQDGPTRTQRGRGIFRHVRERVGWMAQLEPTTYVAGIHIIFDSFKGILSPCVALSCISLLTIHSLLS